MLRFVETLFFLSTLLESIPSGPGRALIHGVHNTHIVHGLPLQGGVTAVSVSARHSYYRDPLSKNARKDCYEIMFDGRL